MPQFNNRSIAAQIAAQNIENFASLQIQTLVSNALRTGLQTNFEEIAQYGRVLAREFRSVREGIAADSVVLATEMEEAAVVQLTANVKRLNAPSRLGQGRFPGMIQQALTHTFEPGNDGVVINLDELEKVAPHYKRINAGAGKIAGSNPFQTAELGQIIERQPEFFLPQGFFSDDPSGSIGRVSRARGGGNQYFFPRSKDPSKFVPTKGIEGKFFLEAAVQHAAVVFPQIVRNRLDIWLERVSTGQAPRLAEIIL